VRDPEDQKPNNAENNDQDAQQKSANQEIGHPLLLGLRMSDAEGSDKCLGEPRKKFQRDTRLPPEYVIFRRGPLGIFG